MPASQPSFFVRSPTLLFGQVSGVRAARSYKQGDVVFEESCAVSALSCPSTTDRCWQCLSVLPETARGEMAIKSMVDGDPAVFCSTSCMERAVREWYSVLCGLGAEEGEAARQLAALNDPHASLVAKFMVRMVWKQHWLVQQQQQSQISDEQAKALAQCVSDEWEHYARLPGKALDEVDAEELAVVKLALKAVAPGVDAFLTAERYASLKGAMMANAFDVEHGLALAMCYLPAYIQRSPIPDAANIAVEFTYHPTRRQKYKQQPLACALSPVAVVRATKDIAEGEQLVRYVEQPEQQHVEQVGQ